MLTPGFHRCTHTTSPLPHTHTNTHPHTFACARTHFNSALLIFIDWSVLSLSFLQIANTHSMYLREFLNIQSKTTQPHFKITCSFEFYEKRFNLSHTYEEECCGIPSSASLHVRGVPGTRREFKRHISFVDNKLIQLCLTANSAPYHQTQRVILRTQLP